MNEATKKPHNLAAVLWLIFFFPIGLFVMWSGTNWNKKAKWGITCFFGLLILIGAASSSTNPKSIVADNKVVAHAAVASQKITEPPQPTDTPAATPTPVPKDINGFPMDAETVTVVNLDKAPSQYEGKKVTFTCIVAGFAKDSSGNAAAVNCSDPNDLGSLVQVSTTSFDMTKINQEDTVRFYGMGGGAAQGKNAFGGEVSETIVVGVYINDITTGYKE